MATKDPRKLLKKAGPKVTCDLCPSFTLIIDDDNTLDIRLHTETGDKEWYFADEDVRAAFAERFTDEVEKLPQTDKLDIDRINKFKQTISQLLIQEVKDGHLFRDSPDLDTEDDEDNDEEDDGGEEHA